MPALLKLLSQCGVETPGIDRVFAGKYLACKGLVSEPAFYHSSVVEVSLNIGPVAQLVRALC